MNIEEIKSELNRRPESYSSESSRALFLAIEYFQDAARHYNAPEGQRAIAALRAIENCFVER